MKPLKFLFIHCSATPEGRDFTGEDIRRFHISPPPFGRGWSRPGYRSVIRLDGTIDKLVDANDNAFVEDDEITFGVKGYNDVSHHVCYVGGVAKDGRTPKNTMTAEQEASLLKIVKWYQARIPGIKILGHNEVAPKACPSFDVGKWLGGMY